MPYLDQSMGAKLVLALAAMLTLIAFWTALGARKLLGQSITKGKICLFQYDSRGGPLLSEPERECTTHPRCHYVGRFGASQISPYWHKVLDSLAILEDEPECSGVLSMESDATLNAPLDHILHLIDAHPESDFIGTYDQPIWVEGETIGFNAGVWFARNTEQGKALLREWLAAYHNEGVAEAWTPKGDSSWFCTAENGQECDWAAAPYYEQGAFKVLLEKGTNTGALITLLKASVLNSRCEEEEACSALVCHFTSLSKPEQIKDWRERKKQCAPFSPARQGRPEDSTT